MFSPRWLSLAILALLASGLQARPVHKQTLALHYGPLLSAKLFDCRTCHLPDAPNATAEQKPHNLFGERLVAIRQELRDKKLSSDIPARLDAVMVEDSDKDGANNLLEILTGHNPGDASDHPSDDDRKSFEAKKIEWDKYRNGYQWRPLAKVSRPAVPPVTDASRVRNPIDAFIAAEHRERGLVARPPATKAVLLRRVYLDLIGLPPTRDELLAFLNDSSPDAYEKIVDKLLQSPQYGERWARHWMDVWRYSDWAGWGNQVRDSQPHIWHWRDWIIESVQNDKRYDRMIHEMLAADEIAPTDENALRGTGYLVRNYKLLSREKWMQDVVDHTFLAFQGTTLGCARCHDHMYDPLTQQEYYRVRAIFEPHQVRTDRLVGQPNIAVDGLPRAFDRDLNAKTFLFIRGDDRTPDTTALEPGIPAAFGVAWPEMKSVSLPLVAQVPDKRPFILAETIAAAQKVVVDAKAKLAYAEARATGCGALALRGAADHNDALIQEIAIAEAKLLALKSVLGVEAREDQGDAKSDAWKADAIAAQTAQRQVALLQSRYDTLIASLTRRPADANAAKAHDQKMTTIQAALTKAEADVKLPGTMVYVKRTITAYPAVSTGRRTALAQWLTSRDNPLTARVAINHMWMRHFGSALVPSVFDFGRNGRRPSMPALLDWLAVELMEGENPWSMRDMHRLMVTSNTYRQASTPDDANLVKDRDNTYYWRMNSRRLEAEVVRDQIFFVAGRLDTTLGGADIDQNQGLTIPRRSIYFRHAAEKQMEFLKLFDTASVTECYQRKDSIIPQQAMALSNSDLTIRHARILGQRLAQASGSEPTNFVKSAFETVLARPATEAEIVACIEFLNAQSANLPKQGAPVDASGNQPAGDPALRARENLILALMNHHDFVTVR